MSIDDFRSEDYGDDDEAYGPYDCLGCGICEDCVEQSMIEHEEQERARREVAFADDLADLEIEP